MKIEESHICNFLSLELIANYYNTNYSQLEEYYHCLENDTEFLEELNKRIKISRKTYAKGLFLNENIDSIDWFGNQRISLYVLIRLLKPDLCVETGVFYGGTTSFILKALKDNHKGRLISIDLPGDELENNKFHRHKDIGNSEHVPENLNTGFLIPGYLKDQWELIEDYSIVAIEKIKEPFTFFSHDSEHSHEYMRKELELARSKMPDESTIFADDIYMSNGFFEFCVNQKLQPLLLPDNGKQGLQTRLGLVYLNHPNNNNTDITG